MRFIPAILILLSAILGGGCASSDGPSELSVARADYPAAFDAAIAAARDEGFISVVLDRRAGLIETEPVTASSILEPWHGDNASAGQAWENTLQFQRRRVRFEFAPADAVPRELPPEGELTGAQVVGDETGPPDLTALDEPLTLRAIVVVERNHSPGERRSAWSRRFVTQSRSGAPDDEDGKEFVDQAGRDAGLPLSFWEPVGRDPAFERRLLARVQELVHGGAAEDPRP